MSRVAYPRERKRGTRGRDVAADQRALTRAGFRPWGKTKDGKRRYTATGQFGPKTVEQVKAFQRAHGLTPDGVIGRMTHAALSKPRAANPYGWYSWQESKDMAAVRRAIDAQESVLMSAKKVVDRIVAAALLTVRYRDQIHYTQGPLRMVGVTAGLFPPNFPRYADCSSHYTWLKFQGGAPDPNLRGYDGFGYTGTQEGHGTLYSVSDAPLSAAVFYGYPVGHVATVVRKGFVVSHGSEIGPILVPSWYRRDARFARLHSNVPRPGFRPPRG